MATIATTTTTMAKEKKRRPSNVQAEKSHLEKLEANWIVNPRSHTRNVTLTTLLRDALLETEEHEGEIRSVAEGLISDIIANARRGNSTAMNLIFERTEGKVPNTSVNVNANFTDSERAARILGILKRGAADGEASDDDPAGESGA